MERIITLASRVLLCEEGDDDYEGSRTRCW